MRSNRPHTVVYTCDPSCRIKVRELAASLRLVWSNIACSSSERVAKQDPLKNFKKKQKNLAEPTYGKWSF